MAEDTKTGKIYEELFNEIKEYHGISDIWIKTLQLLESYGFSDHALAVVCIYFSLLDDGNTCISLDPSMLREKWGEKWNGLVISSGKEDSPDPLSEVYIKEGIAELTKMNDENKLNNLFVIDDGWLIAKKYYDAKEVIQLKMKALFVDYPERPWQSCSLELTPFTEKDGKQKSAVLKGLKRNLIITGGPGTGKTTVAYDILKNILINLDSDIGNWSIYLTAPTGKAKDRLKESINDCINDDKEFQNQVVLTRLQGTEPQTIHSLLRYSPSTNGFTFNKENQFPEKSIFVIDEASMIDICLFASLLDAIPVNAIVFILGDKDQLPSVDAGAVLGSVLGQTEHNADYTVTLTECHRTESKEIWDAACLINKGDAKSIYRLFELVGKSDCIKILKVDKEKKSGLREIVKPAVEVYSNYIGLAASYETRNAEEVFKLTKEFKILCAERKGLLGVENINRMILDVLSGKKKNLQEFFAGELLMITQNIKLLGLSNGDNGVVVHFNGDKDDDNLWFMIRKSEQDSGDEREGIFSKNGFTYYPLYLIPSDSIEVSYAMTIHKSQGSGYDEIMIFLPDKTGHPLLNRQILYTALTRAKIKVTIVASDNSIREAIDNKIERDTMILLDSGKPD